MADTMTVRDDYPRLAAFAVSPSGRDGRLISRRRETGRALDEIDRLRAENARLKALVDFALEHGDA